MRRIGAVAAGLMLAASAAPALGDDHMGLSRDLPITIDDAGKIEAGSVEAKLRSSYARQRNGEHLFTLDPEVEVGVRRGLSLGFSPSWSMGNADSAGQGEAEFELEYNVLEQSGFSPGVTIVPQVSIPFGPGDESVQSSVELLVTQPLGESKSAPRLHLNLGWRYLHDPDPDERRHRYFAAAGVNVAVAENTALAVGVVREPSRERGEADNFVETGVRHVLGEKTVLGAGVGVGLGPDSPRFRLMLGVQRSF